MVIGSELAAIVLIPVCGHPRTGREVVGPVDGEPVVADRARKRPVGQPPAVVALMQQTAPTATLVAEPPQRLELVRIDSHLTRAARAVRGVVRGLHEEPPGGGTMPSTWA
jgi:hypothetical protein